MQKEAHAAHRCHGLHSSTQRCSPANCGVEFSDWERLEKKSGMTVYFAYPHHPWERGSNENTNGLLRQYFPKSMNFNLITSEELAHVVKRLNDRPRKRLDFKSPHSVFLRK